MIFVMGVNHNSQHRGRHHDPAAVKALEFTVRSCRQTCAISVIAEEYSREACVAQGVEESVCFGLASDLRLTHIYCDPSSSEREAIGIPSPAQLQRVMREALGVDFLSGEADREFVRASASYDSRREEFWLQRLSGVRSENVLFVCGANHVDSFVEILVADDWLVRRIQPESTQGR